jgi:hypothetical protein
MFMTEHIYNQEYIQKLVTERNENSLHAWEDEYAKFMATFHEFIPQRWPQPELNEIIILLYGQQDEETFSTRDGLRTKLVMPDQYKDKVRITSSTGLVLELGPDTFIGSYFREGSRTPATVGDWVIFPRNSAQQVTMEGNTFFIVRDEMIKARVANPLWITKGL